MDHKLLKTPSSNIVFNQPNHRPGPGLEPTPTPTMRPGPPHNCAPGRAPQRSVASTNKKQGLKLKALFQVENTATSFHNQTLKPGALSSRGRACASAPRLDDGIHLHRRSLGLRNRGSDWSTRLNHNTIVYQYRPCTQRHCVVPAHYTHSDIQRRPIKQPLPEPLLLFRRHRGGNTMCSPKAPLPRCRI